jgi:hypothetical protein
MSHPQYEGQGVTDDVPLICDPVPGPPVIITASNVLSKADVERLCRMWAEASRGAPNRVRILEAGRRFEPLTSQRTEWPDAEFCAA